MSSSAQNVESLVRNRNNLTAQSKVKQQAHRLLHNYGASETDITACFSDPRISTLLAHAEEHSTILRQQAIERQIQIAHEDNMKIISFGTNFFNAVSQLGEIEKSPSLIKVGQIGALAMTAYTAFEALNTAYTSAAALGQAVSYGAILGPAGMLLSVGMGVATLCLGGGDNGASSQVIQQLTDIKRMLHEGFSQLQQEMQTQYESLSGQIRKVASLNLEILRRQARQFEIQMARLDIIDKSLNVMHINLHDFRSETRIALNHIQRVLDYLTIAGEIREDRTYINETTAIINRCRRLHERQERTPDNINLVAICLEIANLESKIKELSTSARNLKDYQSVERDIRGRLEFLHRRTKLEEFSLSVMAEIFEKITNTSLEEHGIIKENLFLHSLWNEAIKEILLLPESFFKHDNCHEILKYIKDGNDNALKFMKHIGKSDVLFKNLIALYEKTLYEFQMQLSISYNSNKGRLKEFNRPSRLNSCFLESKETEELYQLYYQLNEYFSWLNIFAYLGGRHEQERKWLSDISNGTKLLSQPFTLGEKPEVVSDVLDLCNEVLPEKRGCFDAPDKNMGLDTLGGNVVNLDGNKICYLTISCRNDVANYGDNGKAAFVMDFNQFDIAKDQSKHEYIDTREKSVATVPVSLNYKYPVMMRHILNTCDLNVSHAYASSHIAHIKNVPHFIHYSRGTGEVALKKLSQDFDFLRRPEHEKWTTINTSEQLKSKHPSIPRATFSPNDHNP